MRSEKRFPGSTPWKLELLKDHEKNGIKECYEIIPGIKREDVTKDAANKVFPLGVMSQEVLDKYMKEGHPKELSFRCSDFLSLSLGLKSEKIENTTKEIAIIFEQLDVLDMPEEVRAILLRMRGLFNERS